jgi:Family of unknown function (DUF6210)
MHRILLNPDDSFSLGLLLIVEAATSITYEQQCGNYAVALRRMEGFLIPLGGEREARVIYDWFATTFKGHSYAAASSWSDQTVGELQELVHRVPCWIRTSSDSDEVRSLELDMGRLDQCIEAWIPVLSPYGPGILTLDNSD